MLLRSRVLLWQQFGAIAWRISTAWRWLMAESAGLIIQAVARISWLRWLPRRLLAPVERRLISTRGQDLFDTDFYIAHHADIREAGMDALTHYLRHGWREGRAINPRFDDGHYRAESGLVRGAPISALAHFLAFGRQQGLCPIPGICLEAHGAAAPEIGVARMDPYVHLLGDTTEAASSALDKEQLSARLARLQKPARAPEVAVVMPVYLGELETLSAICHVLEAVCETSFVLIVIDDASPDGSLASALRGLAERGLFRLLVQPDNRGFVAAVNRGCRIAGELDTIWLNSDTEVYDGWIDRLRAAAQSAPRVATVTPLTNNGTICSYPRTNSDNPGGLEISWQALDRIAAVENAEIRIETPTAVGFATYVTRAALDAIGPLDEAAFGRGYGEENDFSQRAIAAGWTNLIATDVVVRHIGAMSFQGTRADRIEAALKVLDRRYPGYHATVADFLVADPVALARRRLDQARLMRLKGARNVLLITHSSGGGTQQHVVEETARLTKAGLSVFLMTGGSGGPRTARLAHASASVMPELACLRLDGSDLWTMLGDLDLEEIHVHHMLDFGAAGPAFLQQKLAELDVPYRFVVHDYLPICPRVNLTDLKGKYCGEPGLSACRRCLDRRGSRVGRVDIAGWRITHGALLAGAREVRVPDVDAAQRLQRYFPRLDNLVVRPHERARDLTPRPVLARKPGMMRIALIGAIGPTKGFDVLLDVARFCRASGQAVEFTVVGYTRDDRVAASCGISVTGAYVNADVDKIIDRIDPDLIWLPSTWPETYSYTLSIALRSGRPISVFDIGALGTRVKGVERATSMPLELSEDPAALWQQLAKAARRVDEERPAMFG